MTATDAYKLTLSAGYKHVLQKIEEAATSGKFEVFLFSHEITNFLEHLIHDGYDVNTNTNRVSWKHASIQ